MVLALCAGAAHAGKAPPGPCSAAAAAVGSAGRAVVSRAAGEARAAAVRGLKRPAAAGQGGAAVRALFGCLLGADGAPRVRREAARRLGMAREADAVPALVAALDDPYFEVSHEAALALAGLGEPAVLAVAQALGGGGPDKRVRQLLRVLVDAAPQRGEAAEAAIAALDKLLAEAVGSTRRAPGSVVERALAAVGAMRATRLRAHVERAVAAVLDGAWADDGAADVLQEGTRALEAIADRASAATLQRVALSRDGVAAGIARRTLLALELPLPPDAGAPPEEPDAAAAAKPQPRRSGGGCGCSASAPNGGTIALLMAAAAIAGRSVQRRRRPPR